MSTTHHASTNQSNSDTAGLSLDSPALGIKIVGSVYVYNGLTIGSNELVTNTGNVVFVEQGAYLSNYGSIYSSSGVGVSLYSDTTLTNGGQITSQSGAAVTTSGYGIYINNSGTIASGSGEAVYFTGSGSLVNSGAITSGSGYGIAQSGGTAYVTNYGSISGGSVGVEISSGTITNDGTISGGNYAVYISGSGTLVDDAGSVFNGTVAAYAGGGSTLELSYTGSATTGTLVGLGTQFSGFGTLDISAGSTWTIQNGSPFYGPTYNYGVVTGGATGVGLSVYTGGFLYNAAGATITANSAAAVVAYGSSLTIVNNGGYITSQSGAGIYLTGTGTIDNYGGTISSGTGYGISAGGGTAYITNTGYIGGGDVGVEISSGTIINSGTIYGGNYAVTITGTGTLIVDPGASFYGQVSGTAGYGDVLDLAGTGDGTLTGLGSQFTGFDTLNVTSGTWTIENGAPFYGTINNYSVIAGSGYNAVTLYNGQTLYNTIGATITAQGAAAVYSSGTGVIINNDGVISSDSGQGIYLTGSAYVTNAGTISSASGYAISSTGTAYITNSGLISGATGVQIAYGTLTNSGTITGSTYAVYVTGSATVVDEVGSVFNGTVAAVAGNGSILDLAGSGSGTLNGLGTQFTGFDTLTITSGTWTIHEGASFYGAIDNYATVTGGATGVGLSVYTGGSLYNAPGAVIESQTAAAVDAYGSNITIVNEGTITSASGVGIYLTGSGSITNDGAITSGSGYGITQSGGYAYVSNEGKISGGNVGVEIANGTITNDGTISGGNYAVYISGSGTLVDDAGSVFNGLVAAYAGGASVLDLAGSGSGTLSGLGTQFEGFGTLDITSGTWTINEGASFYGPINNYATVTGGATGVGISVYTGGSLYNAAGAVIESQTAAAVDSYGYNVLITNDGTISSASGIGIYLIGSGTITNSGAITSTTSYGIAAQAGSTVYITNYGTISGGTVGVEIANGTLTNEGTISGGNYAVYISGSGTLVVYADAVFNGQVTAYAGGGSVLDLADTNPGTLVGLGTQFTGFGTLEISAGATWTIENGGSFYGNINNYGLVTNTTGVGLSVYAGSTLYNASGATITATGAAGVSAYGTAITITNDGLINSNSEVGIYLTGSGTITNAGYITSGTGYGIAASSGYAIIYNSGYIGGGNVGVQIASGTITNAGTISGGNYAVEINGPGRLIVDPGAVFYGQVAATPGYGDVLELSGNSAGYLDGFGTQFTGFSTVQFDTGSDWTLGTNLATANETTFTGDKASATLDLTGGGKLTTAINGFGTLELSGTKAFTFGSAFTLSAGQLDIDQGSRLAAAGAIAVTVNDSGLLEANTNQILRVQGVVTGTGQLGAAAGGTLDVKNTFDVSGGFIGGGTILLQAAGTLAGSSAEAVADIVQSANVTLAAGVVVNDKGNEWTFSTSSATNTVSLVAGSSASKFTTNGTVLVTGAGTTIIDTAFANSAGQVDVQAGTFSLLGAVTNTGTMSALGGSTINIASKVAGTGELNIGAASTLNLAAGSTAGQTVDFQAGTGSLDLGAPSNFGGTITGFGGSDVIDLLNTAATSLKFTNNTLKVLNGSTTVATLHFGSGYALNDFSLTSDGHGGELIKFV